MYKNTYVYRCMEYIKTDCRSRDKKKTIVYNIKEFLQCG